MSDTAKSTTTFTDTGLANGATYAYALFAHDAVPNYATAATTTAVMPPAPVKAVSAVASSGAVKLTWTNPKTASFTGAMVRRAVGAVPPASPADGTLVGDVAGPARTLTDVGLSNGTTYAYAVFAHDGSANYSSPVSVSATPGDTTAPRPETGVGASAGPTSVTLSWANPTNSDFTGVMVRRAVGTTPPSSATSGTLVSDTAKSTTTFTDTGLANGATYAYALFAHDAVPNYATAATTTAVMPPAPVKAVSAVASSGAVKLTWTNPKTASFTGAMVRRAVGAVPPASPADGTLVGDVAGPARTLTDVGLSNGTTYAYAVFAHDGSANYSSPVSVSATPGDTTAPRPVTGVGASAGPTSVTLSWANPTNSDFTGVMVRRAVGTTPPSSATSGTLVSDTAKSTTTFTDTGLANGATYAYALFAHDAVPNYATAATTSLTVTCAGALRDVSGTIAINATWTVDGCSRPYVLNGTVTIASGTTLRIKPGVVVKATRGSRLSVQGSLVAAGTAASPVVFTSYLDDGVGGDTNGDGNATSPTAGDWTGIYGVGSTVTLDHVRVGFADEAVQTNSASLAVTNSVVSDVGDGVVADYGTLLFTNNTITRASGSGVYVTEPSAPPAITGNTVTNGGGQAVVVRAASVDLAKLTGNSGSGNKGNGVFLTGGDTQSVDASVTWSGTLLPVLQGGCYAALTVAAGVTLTLNAGTVVKAITCATLSVQGSLVAAGTAASPVVFTSYLDDGVGGDTNGDGNATSPTAGDWTGIYGVGSTVTLDHVRVGFADEAVQTNSASLAVTNSVVSDVGDGVVADYGTLLFTNNTITRASGSGVYVTEPSAPPAITGNTVTNGGGQAVVVRAASVDLAKLTGNSGSGNKGNGVFLTGGDTQSVDASVTWSGTLLPVLQGGCYAALTVAAGVTLTLNAGTVVKAITCATLSVQGSLVAAGTAASPVVFTSYLDDGVGGDTNGDGNATSPTAGDWTGIAVGGTSVATLDGVSVQYADTALSASGNAEMVLHGSVAHSALGIAAGDAYVDATHVDWGSSSGPSPIGSGVGFIGDGVDVTPWVGYVAPTVPAPSQTGTPPDVPSGCKRFMFLAVRGSGEPTNKGISDSADDDAYTDWLDGFGPNIWTVYGGFAASLRARGLTDSDWKGIGLRYRAMHVPLGETALGGLILAPYSDASYFASVWQGVDRIGQYLMDEYAKCGSSERFVLSGYSQGALAIHLYLTQRVPSYIRPLIASVGLLADPSKNKNGREAIFTNDWVNARSHDQGIVNATGIYSKAQLPGSGPLPADVAKRTATMCHNNDIVCAPGFGSQVSSHLSYTDGERSSMGAWLAGQAIAAVSALQTSGQK